MEQFGGSFLVCFIYVVSDCIDLGHVCLFPAVALTIQTSPNRVNVERILPEVLDFLKLVRLSYTELTIFVSHIRYEDLLLI